MQIEQNYNYRRKPLKRKLRGGVRRKPKQGFNVSPPGAGRKPYRPSYGDPVTGGTRAPSALTDKQGFNVGGPPGTGRKPDVRRKTGVNRTRGPKRYNRRSY